MAVQTQRLLRHRTLSYPSISPNVRVLIMVLAALVGFLGSGFYLSSGGPSSPRGAEPAFVAVPLECGDGTCDCGDGICSPQVSESPTSCAIDCTTIPVCGDGVCEAGENGVQGDNNYCASDCSSDTCNENGRCGSWENASCIDCTGWPTCGDGTCNGTETSSTCSADCTPPPPTCNGGAPDGTCAPGETSTSCSDCATTACNADGTCDPTWETDTCVDCWNNSLCSGGAPNGVCSGEKASSCYADCHCGDGTCDLRLPYDEQVTCPGDCGGGGPVCGNAVCEGDEASTCPADCTKGPVCGNNTCDVGETTSSCPADCTPTYCGTSPSCQPGENPSLCPNDCSQGGCNGDAVCDSWESTSCAACQRAAGPICGNNSCEAGESASSCAADCTPTQPSYCGDGVCRDPEDAGWCPADCKVLPRCGDNACNGDETSETCVADCPLPPTVCGNKVCEAERGETASTCAADCVTRFVPTRTPTPTPTNEPTDEPTDAPADQRTEAVPERVAEVTTSEPPTVEPQPETSAPSGALSETADLTVEEKEFVEEFEATLLANCRLIRLDDADADVKGRLAGFSDELLLFADRVLICDSQPESLCVPAANDISDVDEVQIVSCGEVGNCKVYQATELKEINDETVACITKRLGRPMPTCKDACATGIGIRVTEADVSGYVLPFGIMMTIVSIGGVWFTFVFSRTRNRDMNEEIEGMDDEGIVTKTKPD